MIAAIVVNGVVKNRIVVDSLAIMSGLIDGSAAKIGDAYDAVTGEFTTTAQVITRPDTVKMAAARIAMLRNNVLSDVEAAILLVGGEAVIWWDKAEEIRRSHPLVSAISAGLGWTNSFVDQLFIEAKEIEETGG